MEDLAELLAKQRLESPTDAELGAALRLIMANVEKRNTGLYIHCWVGAGSVSWEIDSGNGYGIPSGQGDRCHHRSWKKGFLLAADRVKKFNETRSSNDG